jgi:signal transduction histidine kinase
MHRNIKPESESDLLSKEIASRRAALKGSHETTRLNAILALGELGDEGSIPDLIAIVKNGETPRLRGEAAYALGRLDAYEAMPDLKAGLSDESHFVRRECVKALRRLGEEVSPSEFFVQQTHKLRGPMQAIRGDVGYLLDKLESGGTLSEVERERLEAIDSHMIRLATLLDNFSYIHLSDDYEPSATYNIQKHSISSLIHRAAHHFRLVARLRDIEIEIDSSVAKLPELELDRDAMFTAFINLIDNAVRFSDLNQAVKIAGGTTARSIIVSIANIGIGIVGEDYHQIFHPYYRSEAASYTADRGIGLAVAKRIIDDHGGTISVESTPVNEAGDLQLHRVVFAVELPLPQNRR